MNVFQTCRNTADAIPLYLPQQLYLKPAARLNITIQIPNVKKFEKSISHWEIMEKLRTLIRPDEFSVLKVGKTTLEFVRFEAEIENRTRLDKVLSKLDNNSIKLKEIPDLVRVKAGEVKHDVPTRHKWDPFFQEAKDMDEMKPGQRPDTIHFSYLPKKWFIPYHLADDEDVVPSEKMFYRIFEKFGLIRYVDIPICDPYRKKMKDHISGIKAHKVDDKDFFEGYIQFKDYLGFTRTMDAFKGMKLLKKDEDEAFTVSVKIDFDRTKHLSDASIRRREIVRDRLVKKHREKEEKEEKELDAKKTKEQNERQKEIKSKSEKVQRRKEREQKRKAKILDKLKINGCDEINEKIAKEEKKLLKAQRKLEAIRLVEELFRRIKDKKDELRNDYNNRNKRTGTSGADELRRYKNLSELEVLTQRQNLHNAIEGRVVLKSILSSENAKEKKKRRSRSRSSNSSNSSLSSPSHAKRREKDAQDNFQAPPPPTDPMYDSWYYPPPYAPPMYAPPIRPPYVVYPPRGRGLPMAGPSRGPGRRGRGGYRGPRYRGGGRGVYGPPYHHPAQHLHGGYAPEVEEEYIKYFSKFYDAHDDRRSRSRTRSRSRSRYSRSRSRSRSRRRRSTRSRSRSRSRSRTKSRSGRSKRTRSRSRSRSRSKSRSRRDRDKDRSPSHFTPPRRRNEGRESKKDTSDGKEKNSVDGDGNGSRRSASVDSSKFVSPKSMRKAGRERSKSWSLPRSGEGDKDKDRRSWSKSPESNKEK